MKRFFRALILQASLLGLILLNFSFAHAADPALIGEWPGHSSGSIFSTKILGNRAYLAADKAGLLIVDISNPRKPAFLGAYTIGKATDPRSLIRGVDVVGNLAFLGTSYQGFQVVDVSDPTKPVRIGSYAPNASFERVIVVGQRVYVSDGGGNGFVVLDVSDPAKPTRLGSFSGGSDFQIIGNVAYLVSAEGLLIVDVSNPAQPRRLGRYGSISAAHVIGNRAYVVKGFDSGPPELQIVDVSDPAHPIQIGHFRLENFAIHVAIHGIEVYQNLAYLTLSGGPGPDPAEHPILDISDPSNPKQVGSFGGGTGTFVEPNLAYLSNGNGLEILDTTDPIKPRRLGVYHAYYEVFGVQIVDKLAYVATSWGLQILDVTNPARPSLVATVPDLVLPNVIGNLAYGIRFTGTDAFLPPPPDTVFFEVHDIGDLSKPRRLGRYSVWYSGGHQVKDGIAYVTDGSGLLILDVRDSTKFALLGRYPLAGARGVQVVQNLAYVFGGSTGLDILDVSNPAKPELKSHHATGGYVTAAQFVDDMAYFAKWTQALGKSPVGYLEILDVADPISPVRRSVTNFGPFANAVRVHGNLVYVAGGQETEFTRLDVFEVSNPARPVRVGRYQLDAFFGSRPNIEVIGTQAYLAAGSEGLKILDLTKIVQPSLSVVHKDGTPNLQLSGVISASYSLEHASSFPAANWTPLATVTLTNSPQIVTDPDAAKFPQRFYRALAR